MQCYEQKNRIFLATIDQKYFEDIQQLKRMPLLIHVGAVEEGWEKIRCGVQDVNGGVIRDVRV